MKSMLIAILAAKVLCAQVPEPVLRQIGADAHWVYGGDIGRYRHSAWQQVAPWYIDSSRGDGPILFVTSPATAPVPEASKRDAPLSETALKVKRLAESYDVWFLILRPLEQAGFANPTKHGKELLEVVQEASGGMRLGPQTELHLEVVADNPENALTLAGVARWMPGLLSLEEHRPFAPLVELVESLSIRAEGTRVTVSGYVSESRLRDAISAWEKRRAVR